MNDFSVFSTCKTNKPDSILSIESYVENIRTGIWQDQVLDYRARRIGKDNIKAITASGRFDSKRSADNLVKHSGYIAIDIDQKDNSDTDLLKAREYLYADPYVSVGHVSLGGFGLVLFIKIEPKKHSDSFAAIESYLLDTYKIICDKSCKDVSRLRFVSYDEDIYYNKSAKTWDLFTNKERQEPPNYNHVHRSDNIDFIIDQIKQRRIDITDSYSDWIKIGFALASEYGELGRTYFHEISQFHPKYSVQNTDKQFNNCLKTGKNVNISSLYWIAKVNGLSTKTEKVQKIEGFAKLQRELVAAGKQSVKQAKKTTQDYLKAEGIKCKESEQIIEQVFNMSDAEVNSDPVPIDIQVINYLKTLNLKHNQVTRRVEIKGEDITDRDLNSIYLDCREIFKKGKFPREFIGNILDSNRIPSYHPFIDFFDKYKDYPRTGELIKLYECFYLSDEYDSDTALFILSLIEKWLISIVAAMNGTYSLLILVLVGKQATGKTNFFRHLLPAELEKKYYAESKLDKGTDDELLLSQKLLIVDDEFAGKSKKEAHKLKDLSSKDKITARKSYGRYAEDYKRYAVLGGTSNDSDIINDPTGNRRVIPVHINYFDFVKFREKVDKIGLFLELFDLWKEVKDGWMLTKEDINRLSTYGEYFSENSIEEDSIHKYFEKAKKTDINARFFTTTEMVNYCELRLAKQKIGIKRFAQMLHKCGFERVKKGQSYGYYAICNDDLEVTSGNFAVTSKPPSYPF